MDLNRYNEEDIAVIKVIIKEETERELKKINISGPDAEYLYWMIYNRTLKEKYGIEE